MSTLSVCIVTKNEELNIAACLDSVAWADEIVVIDSESSDRTVEICRRYTDKILITPWQGCGPQKRQAYELASKDWVLILDADERLTQELQTEIKALLALPVEETTGYTAYRIPFQSYYCNKAIRFGDWINENHVRLIKRDKGQIIPRFVHFRVEVTGKIGKLTNKILHYSFPSLEVVINKMNRYSTDGAIHKQQKGRRASIWQAIGHGLFAFIRGYIFKLGFLDGREGFMLAISNAEGSYYRYLKLIYLSPYAKCVEKNVNLTVLPRN